jgi:hypothetical protein
MNVVVVPDGTEYPFDDKTEAYVFLEHMKRINAGYQLPIRKEPDDDSEVIDGMEIVSMAFELIVNSASKADHAKSTAFLVDQLLEDEDWILEQMTYSDKRRLQQFVNSEEFKASLGL